MELIAEQLRNGLSIEEACRRAADKAEDRHLESILRHCSEKIGAIELENKNLKERWERDAGYEDDYHEECRKNTRLENTLAAQEAALIDATARLEAIRGVLR